MKFSDLVKLIDSGIKLNTLEDRISFQKKFYFLNKLGIIEEDLDFGLFIHGPYSSKLATIGFDFFERKIDTDLKTSENISEKIIIFNSITYIFVSSY